MKTSNCEGCGLLDSPWRGDLNAYLCDAHSAAWLAERPGPAPTARALFGDPRAMPLEFVSWAQLRRATPPEPAWVLRHFVARGAVTLLAGKPKTGKSTLACALTEAVDAEAPTFLGQRVDGGPVVYLSEEGAGTLAPKLPASGRSSALTRDAAFPKPSWPDLIAAAVAEADRIDAVLLVVDALSFWAGFAEGQEKDAGTTQAAMDALVAATAASLAVLIVHHQRKAGGEDGDAVRGSGAIFGAVEALVEVERVGEDAPQGQRRLVTVARWPSPPVLLIDRSAATGAWRVVGEAESRTDAAVLGYRDRLLQAIPAEAPGATENEIAELIGVDRRKVGKPLRELVNEGLLQRSGAGAKGDPYTYWNAPPDAPPGAGENQAQKCSPSPIGGEHVKAPSPRPLGGERGSVGETLALARSRNGSGPTLEDAILDPERVEQIRASVGGEWVDPAAEIHHLAVDADAAEREAAELGLSATDEEGSG